MATHIYLPVWSKEMVHISNEWNGGLVARKQEAHQVISSNTRGFGKWWRRHKHGLKLLSHVAKDDTLYVLAHGLSQKGDGGAVTIGVLRGADYVRTSDNLTGYKTLGGEFKMYTPANFAKHLNKEGLPLDFVDLRLFCCDVGLKVQRGGKTLAPYASRLKDALAVLKYTSIRVTGYLGELEAKIAPRTKARAMVADKSTDDGVGLGVLLPGSTYPSLADKHTVVF